MNVGPANPGDVGEEEVEFGTEDFDSDRVERAVVVTESLQCQDVVLAELQVRVQAQRCTGP